MRDIAGQTVEVPKKRKSDIVRDKKIKKEKKANPNQCEYYLVQKRRRCAMQRKKDRRYCSEHIALDDTEAATEVKEERVPCPLDPKHSVWAKDLKFHLTKCPAKPVESTDPWFERNRNSQLRNNSEDKDILENVIDGGVEVEKQEKKEREEEEVDINQSQMAKYIDILRKFNDKMSPMDVYVKHHPGLDHWHEEKANRKHIDQQSSLVGQLKEVNLLSPQLFYVEFGCGKGELSRTVNKCILHDYKISQQEDEETSTIYGYGLIDRGVNRMKMDNKILKDCKEAPHPLDPVIKRSRIDIEHLDLDKFLESAAPKGVVGISKHLCGVATDLTLKSIFNSSILESKFQGLVVAMCCRHACNYKQLLSESKAFLALNGITNAQDFKYIKMIVTWAVCGPGNDSNHENQNHISGLTYAEREQVGHMARRLIDESRVYAVNKMIGEKFHAQMYKYAESSTTLENSCLRIYRK